MKNIFGCLVFVLPLLFACACCEAGESIASGIGCMAPPSGTEINLLPEGPGMPAAQIVSHYETAQNVVAVKNDVLQNTLSTGRTVSFISSSGNLPISANIVVSGDRIVLFGDIAINGSFCLVGSEITISDILSGLGTGLLNKGQPGGSVASTSSHGISSVNNGAFFTMQNVQSFTISSGSSLAVSGEMTVVEQKETKARDAEAEAIARDAMRRQQQMRERMLKSLLGEDEEE